MWAALAGLVLDKNKQNKTEDAANEQAEEQRRIDLQQQSQYKRAQRQAAANSIQPNGIDINALVQGVFTNSGRSKIGGFNGI